MMLADKLPKIWKLSQSYKYINDQQQKWLSKNKYMTMARDTQKGQVPNFIRECQVGDIVNLGTGRYLKALVRVTSDIISDENSPLDKKWLFRHYEIICLPKKAEYTGGNREGWSPSGLSTFKPISELVLPRFESEVLLPNYGINLTQLKTLWREKMSKENQQEAEERSFPFPKNRHFTDNKPPLNQILYGPPGTGKTYETILRAVEICEPDFIWQDRNALKAKYDELVLEKRIRFVTFHQSYGYEEFVEGLRAETDDKGNISYEIQDGLLKQICLAASIPAEELVLFEEALKKLKDLCARENGLSLKTERGKEFRAEYKEGNRTFKAFPLEEKAGYAASIDGLRHLFLTGEKICTNASYVWGLLDYMQTHLDLKPVNYQKDESKILPYVLIIDEINRGNISKIFGELITLIESSKRQGEEEALSLILPYSGEEFSVPNNVYLIGTMNTADRSLTMMDTALRRRFHFTEMMPESKRLAGKKMQDIDLEELLEIMNQRIEILYDREHMLGHAFFMNLEENNIQDLKAVFQNKIIPLLQEYFFEDWEKIALVLGDNQKQNKEHKFIREDEINHQNLFGNNLKNFSFPEKIYTLAKAAEAVWSEPEAYKAIYAGSR